MVNDGKTVEAYLREGITVYCNLFQSRLALCSNCPGAWTDRAVAGDVVCKRKQLADMASGAEL